MSIPIRKNIPWFGKYLTITVDGEANFSDTYELQGQLVNTKDTSISYAVVTLTEDETVQGRYHITLDDTSDVPLIDVGFIVLLRPIATPANYMIIYSKFCDVITGAVWQ